MGLRLFRRVKIFPGITLNISKSGPSISFGTRGARVTLGPRSTRTTMGIPGTGISYSQTHKRKTAEDSVADDGYQIQENSIPGRVRHGFLYYFFIVLLLMVLFGAIMGLTTNIFPSENFS